MTKRVLHSVGRSKFKLAIFMNLGCMLLGAGVSAQEFLSLSGNGTLSWSNSPPDGVCEVQLA
jgi:hypothetical protein